MLRKKSSVATGRRSAIAGAASQTVDRRTFLRGSGLATQKFPERLEVVDELPRTASGKVQKNVLRDRIRNLIESE